MRDDRPLFHDEIGIPWDEYQLACIIAIDAGIAQRSWGHETGLRLYFEDQDVDGRAADLARPASAKLRAHPSHRKVAAVTGAMTPKKIQSIVDVLTMNRDSADLMASRGVDPFEVRQIGQLACGGSMANAMLVERLAEMLRSALEICDDQQVYGVDARAGALVEEAMAFVKEVRGG